MVRMGSNSPLTITEEAQEVIENMRIVKKFAKSDFLRVKAQIPTFDSDCVTFNMFFEDTAKDTDMAYMEGTTKVLLDIQTAHLLVGSQLFRTASGELAFDHLDTTSCFDMDDKPIKN